jgi:hypothetical protein
MVSCIVFYMDPCIIIFYSVSGIIVYNNLKINYLKIYQNNFFFSFLILKY